jgi:type III secretion system FlhB-like substrate exporter
LKLQEDCRLPIAMVYSVLANTASIVENNVTNLQNEIKSCIQNAGIEVNTVPGLVTLLGEDNLNKRIFEDFYTNKKRVVYYKDNFGLKVTTLTYFYKLYYKTPTQAHDKLMLP